ncbi:MAG: HDOD domain-containing protein [Betaproteobacteria bacterium]|nr:HDOD domain-containing protein [Betaproteobacteria bacterium]
MNRNIQLEHDALVAEIERDLAAGHLSFPSFLDVPIKIQRMLERETVGIDDLVPLVKIEPVLAARLIGLANSALYGTGREPAKDVRAAMLRIGTAAVRSLAMVVATAQLARAERLGAARPYAARLWDHCVDVAAWCYALAKHSDGIKPDEAMLIGLLSNIGQFYLLSKAADYPALLDREAELSEFILGWHKQITRAVLRSFGVPISIQDAIDDHEIYDAAFSLGNMADILFVAELATETPNPLSGDGARLHVGLLEAATLGIDEPEFRRIMAEAAAERRSVLAALRA